MAYNFSTSSPSVLLPAQPIDQYFAPNHGANGAANGMSNGQAPGTAGSLLTPNDSLATTPGSLAGRKRSRGDVHAPPEEEEGLDDGSTTVSETGASDSLPVNPILGNGTNTNDSDDTGHAAATESQFGTWVEERAQRNQFQLSHVKRPSISTRKSQRMDANASNSDNLAQLVLPPQMREATTEPLIDEATRVLGISWTRMDSSEVLKISRAAYSKWIQNHYAGLKDVSVWFENSAIPGYLAAATNAYSGRQEYYIFSNDLTEARLVTGDPQQLVPRLKMLPALHLAAPGGCIRAETDPITASQNAVKGFQAATVDGAVVQEPEDVCTAHSMEID